MFDIGSQLVVFFLFPAELLVDRAMAPFNRVTDALRAVEAGDYDVKLPALPGAEANAIGRTFNSMVDSVRTSIAAREAAALSRCIQQA